MAERGIDLDRSTMYRWVLYFSPKLLDRFNFRKRQVEGEWLYLYRAIDTNGVRLNAISAKTLI